jgi:hypothetical protein
MARALPFPAHKHPPKKHNAGLGLMGAVNKAGGAGADVAGQGEAGEVSEITTDGATDTPDGATDTPDTPST